MTAEWPIRTIAECASPDSYSTQIGPFGKALMADEYTESGVPVLRGVNVNRGRFHDDDFVFINEEAANRLSKFESFPGDVLLVHKGTLGQIGLMPRSRKYARYIMGNSMMRVRCDPTKVLPEYLYYWLSSPEGQHYLFSRVSQVGVPQIQTPLTTLREAELPVPPIPEQSAIVEILGALDSKIELNQRMNETLEGVARAIFKSWFVNFDPVRAKMEGDELSRIDSATAELFPRELVDSPHGPMPTGWKAATIGDIADVVRGRSYRSAELNESRTALVTLKSFLRGGGYRADGLKPFTGAYKPEQVVAPGEVVVACTDVTQAAEVVGRPAVVLPDERFETLVPSLDVVVIRPRAKGIGQSFLYFLIESEEFRAHTYAHTSGTTVLHLDRKCIPDFPFVLPSGPVLEAYDRVASPSFQRITSNVREIALLESLRDAILPKLVSGQIRLGDAEEMAAASL